LRDLFLSSDVRLAVFAACETATVMIDDTSQQRRRSAVDATLATSLVTAQVPAVVAMPFLLQDDLSPTFMYHFYEALADGRTLDEALSRSRQALLPMQQKSWFVPVLYRRAVEGEEEPVPLIANRDTPQEHDHPLAHLGIPSVFVGRERELHDLDELLTIAAAGGQRSDLSGRLRSRSGMHHIVLTGVAGIGKSALAFEVIQRNQEKFPGGVIGIALQQGRKSFADALFEIMHHVHIPTRATSAADVSHRARLVLRTLRSLASRELSCLLFLDGFEVVEDRAELEAWMRFLCSLPEEVVVLVTSHTNPGSTVALEGLQCRWYEYRIGKMVETDLLKLFAELAAESGLDQRIQLIDARQQEILCEICTLLDGYPLGAELIFGTARTIGGKVYTPEAATRPLEEVRDELCHRPLAGISAALEIAHQRLTPLACSLLAYLAAFCFPFSREHIMMLFAPETRQHLVTTELAEHWRAARDELVQASFIQFDGRAYTIHSQVRHFALAHLPDEERQRVHRMVAGYYCDLSSLGSAE
jgi:hypothetical protein